MYSARVTSENKTIHLSLPPSHIQSWGVCCLLQVARTAAQHCMEGMRKGKLYSLFLKSIKRQKGPLEQSVSTNFVADCSKSIVEICFKSRKNDDPLTILLTN